MLVEGLGEADHGFLFEEAAASVLCEAVRVQFSVVAEDEALDNGPPGLHHVTNQTRLTKLNTVQEPKIGVKMCGDHARARARNGKQDLCL